MQNVAKTFNDVGLEAGMSAGTMVGVMSSINNIGQVLSGDKEAGEAFLRRGKSYGQSRHQWLFALRRDCYGNANHA